MLYNYYPNNQFYMQDLQNMKEKIDRQMQQIQQQNQIQQPQIPQVNQTFQLAPNPTNNELESRYVNNIDEVKNTFVMKIGIFLNKDFTNLWIKNTDGSIRTFELNEIIEIDPKDREIQMLKQELERMKGMIKENESNVNNSNNDGEYESKNATKLPSRKQSNAK